MAIPRPDVRKHCTTILLMLNYYNSTNKNSAMLRKGLNEPFKNIRQIALGKETNSGYTSPLCKSLRWLPFACRIRMYL